MSTQTQVEIGSDFLGYRIEALVGRGGMGVVYRAYDLRLKRTVALKLVTPELALDERFKERFARETELTMALEHPNVVPIHDAGDLDGRLYLAMRLVEGTDLRALLATEKALEPVRALAICGQVAHALDAAHGRGLVHRDVKPSNVLLDANEHVYLADFGLTRRLEEQGIETVTFGQFNMNKDVLVTADVERLPAHRLRRRIQDRKGCTGDVLDVDERPPGRAVAEDSNGARRHRPAHEVVEDDVET